MIAKRCERLFETISIEAGSKMTNLLKSITSLLYSLFMLMLVIVQLVLITWFFVWLFRFILEN